MDFFDLKAGDTEPSLGKKIKEIILCSDTFIVYMDEDDVIQWSTSEDDEVKDFGEVPNQISYWESIVNRLFPKQEAYDYKTLLAEGYARILDDKKLESARNIIDQTVGRIKIQGKEVLRQEYLKASLTTTAVIALIIIISVFLKNVVLDILGSNVIEIYLGGLMGGIGAFVSTMIRSKNYNAEVSVSKEIHKIDGMLRIIYGVIAGVIIGIGIKANIIFGFVNQINKTIYVYAFLCAMGGASEIILPNIIKQIEDKA